MLGAVHWVRSIHPEQARKIFGIGADTGGAALIAAAAEDSDDGRAIAALAVDGCFSNMKQWAASLANTYFLPPVNWSSVYLSLPAASLQTGVDIGKFSPAKLVMNLWPRPILVIHGSKDDTVPVNESIILYNSATIPKDRYWLDGASHDDAISNERILRYVKEFFDNADTVPVI